MTENKEEIKKQNLEQKQKQLQEEQELLKFHDFDINSGWLNVQQLNKIKITDENVSCNEYKLFLRELS